MLIIQDIKEKKNLNNFKFFFFLNKNLDNTFNIQFRTKKHPSIDIIWMVSIKTKVKLLNKGSSCFSLLPGLPCIVGSFVSPVSWVHRPQYSQYLPASVCIPTKASHQGYPVGSCRSGGSCSPFVCLFGGSEGEIPNLFRRKQIKNVIIADNDQIQFGKNRLTLLEVLFSIIFQQI